MGILIKQLENISPRDLNIPEPIRMLYSWIEENNLHQDNEKGERFGFLYSQEKLMASWEEDGREGGTLIEFSATRNDTLEYWFGDDSREITSRLCVFAKSGREGSECGLWKANDGSLKIVHMGSGSGSSLTCVLADDAVDFLRLLAIGYDEICWDEDFDLPPNESDKEYFVKPNTEFQDWVKNTFKVTIPKTALEIVKNPAQMDDDETDDPFLAWVNSMIR